MPLHLLSFEEGDTSALENLIEVAELMDLDESSATRTPLQKHLPRQKNLSRRNIRWQPR